MPLDKDPNNIGAVSYYRQDSLPLKFQSPLSDQTVVIKDLVGTEKISDLYHISVDLLWVGEPFEFRDILGKEVCINVGLDFSRYRFFSGIVSRFSEIDPFSGSRAFRAEIVPFLYFGTLQSNCRVFQDKTIPEIVEEVIGSLPSASYEFRTSNTYQPLPYCVQYRESDFAFISRLLEQAGIFYYFEHQSNHHSMILCDSPGSREEVPDLTDPCKFYNDPESKIIWPHISHFNYEQVMRPGKYAITDYNFLDPNTKLLSEGTSSLDIEGINQFEIFDYPGDFVKTGPEDSGKLERGDEEATLLTNQSDTRSVEVSGRSNHCQLSPGYLFTMDEHPSGLFNTEYLLTSIEHRASQASHFTSNEETNEEYKNKFKAVPGDIDYFPEVKTHRPLVSGPQTAIVVGPDGEEIYTDKYGRVKVQFYWDRFGNRDENSSCWVRVVQNWAGKNWGAMFHPRIGQEVVINFIEGDPDRPLITGRVYNAEQPIPYTVATQSGIKSRSTKEGTAENFNEIRFEDKKGSEELYIQAEKNKEILVKANKSETIGANETRSIGSDQSESVGSDRTCEIGSNRSTTIGKDESLTIGEDRTQTVGSNETITIGKNQTFDVATKRTTSIGSDDALSVGGKSSHEVGDSAAVKIAKNYTLDIGSDGNIKVGKKLTIEAGDELTIKVGKASIQLKKNGEITIKGKDIKLDGSGKITVKASKDLTLKGSKVQSN